jgi:hypothetical protein
MNPMQTKKSRRNPHKAGAMMDFAHVVLCLGVVATAVIIFLNPAQFARLFPLVFALAAGMQFLHGIPKIMVYVRRHRAADRGTCAAGAVLSVLGVILLGLAVVSAITTW